MHSGSAALMQFQADHPEIYIHKSHSTGVKLGRWAYGKVFEVEYHGQLCALVNKSTPNYSKLTKAKQPPMLDTFLRECNIWSAIHHPNVVSFLGVYYPTSKQFEFPIIVMEKMQQCLSSLIEKHQTVSLMVKLSILHDVSLRMRYFHGHKPPIVHRDLTSNNILLTPCLEAKISDLGVAKVLIRNRKALTETPGNDKFMPPGNKPDYGLPLDVFSFAGVIV